MRHARVRRSRPRRRHRRPRARAAPVRAARGPRRLTSPHAGARDTRRGPRLLRERAAGHRPPGRLEAARPRARGGGRPAPPCGVRALLGQHVRRRLVAAHRGLAPDLPRSYTLPRDRLGVSKRGPLAPVVRGALASLGASLPRRLPALLQRSRADAFTLHHSLASPAAIARAHELGAPVYVWTVDDPALAERLVRAGADGIITNDPRVLTGLSA